MADDLVREPQRPLEVLEPTLDELDRTLRLADDVIRHKIVRVPRHAGGRVRPPAVEEAAAAAAPPGPARTS